MPKRLLNGVSHITKVPKRYGDGQLPVYVRIANSNVLNFWHNNVQLPYINTLRNRADKNWNWPTMFITHSTIASLLGQKPNCYTIGVKLNDLFLPLSLLFVAEKYPALHEHRRDSSFIWYLATAPEDFLLTYLKRADLPARLGVLCIDVGITTSFNNNNAGLIGLHAAQSGGQKLIRFYADKCGLNNLPKKSKLTLGRNLIGGNDGRYFYTDESIALSISIKNDLFRT